MDMDSLGKRLTERIGQTVLTCPTASCFDGLPDAADRLSAGRALRVFGDKLQISKVVGGERYWRIPVMEGECLMQESFGVQKKGVGGGNFRSSPSPPTAGLAAAEAAVRAIEGMPGVILPFPAAWCAAAAVGARSYTGMIASTNDAYCPTVRPRTKRNCPTGSMPCSSRARRARRADDQRRDACRHRRRLPSRRQGDRRRATAASSAISLPSAPGDGRHCHMSVRLALRTAIDQSIEIDGLTPDRVATLSEAESPACRSSLARASWRFLYRQRRTLGASSRSKDDLHRVDGLGAGTQAVSC